MQSRKGHHGVEKAVRYYGTTDEAYEMGMKINLADFITSAAEFGFTHIQITSPWHDTPDVLEIKNDTATRVWARTGSRVVNIHGVR